MDHRLLSSCSFQNNFCSLYKVQDKAIQTSSDKHMEASRDAKPAVYVFPQYFLSNSTKRWTIQVKVIQISLLFSRGSQRESCETNRNERSLTPTTLKPVTVQNVIRQPLVLIHSQVAASPRICCSSLQLHSFLLFFLIIFLNLNQNLLSTKSFHWQWKERRK